MKVMGGYDFPGSNSVIFIIFGNFLSSIKQYFYILLYFNIGSTNYQINLFKILSGLNLRVLICMR